MKERILITGASSGLGAALARHYATPGRTLILWGRDQERLEQVAGDCHGKGAAVSVRSLDLIDSAAAIAAIEEEDAAGALDIAILAAGLGDIQASHEQAESPVRMMRLGIVNFVTPSAMAAAAAGRMGARGHGHIILIGSAAGFHALPFAAAYSASKAGLARFAQALRVGVKPHGVRVLLVSPGPIDTPAGRKVPAPRPLLMQPAQVAARIARASARGRAHLILPHAFSLLRLVDRLLPAFARDGILRRLRP